MTRTPTKSTPRSPDLRLDLCQLKYPWRSREPHRSHTRTPLGGKFMTRTPTKSTVGSPDLRLDLCQLKYPWTTSEPHRPHTRTPLGGTFMTQTPRLRGVHCGGFHTQSGDPARDRERGSKMGRGGNEVRVMRSSLWRLSHPERGPSQATKGKGHNRGYWVAPQTSGVPDDGKRHTLAECR